MGSLLDGKICYFQDYSDVKKFIDDIYIGLMSKEIELELSTDLANVFAIMTLTSATEITQLETSLVDDVEIIDDVTLNSFDLVRDLLNIESLTKLIEN